jgi:hypothetical protein
MPVLIDRPTMNNTERLGTTHHLTQALAIARNQHNVLANMARVEACFSSYMLRHRIIQTMLVLSCFHKC